MLLGFAADARPPHETEDIKRIVRDLAAEDAAKRRINDVTEVTSGRAEHGRGQCAGLSTEAEGREPARARGGHRDVDFILRWQRTGASGPKHRQCSTGAPPGLDCNGHRPATVARVPAEDDLPERLHPQHRGLGERKTMPMNHGKTAAMEVCAVRLLSNDYSPRP